MLPLATAALVGGIAAPVIGGIMGGKNAQADRDAAMQRYQEMLGMVNAIQTPDIDKMKLQLAQYQSQGVLTPELEQSITQGQSAMNNVQVDPRLQASQMQNLDMLNQIAQSGGFDPSVKADLAQAMQRMQQNAAAQQKSAQQQAEMRGMSSSGANMALQAMAAQNEANNSADIGSKLASSAYQNKLNALNSSSGLAGNLRNQQFGEQSAVANANDAISRFNAQMAQSAQSANINAKNQAQAANLAAKQSLSNANTDVENRQQQYNKNLSQQDYENKLRKASLITGAGNTYAGALQGRGNATADMWAGIGAGLGKGLGAYASYAGSQKPEVSEVSGSGGSDGESGGGRGPANTLRPW